MVDFAFTLCLATVQCQQATERNQHIYVRTQDQDWLGFTPHVSHRFLRCANGQVISRVSARFKVRPVGMGLRLLAITYSIAILCRRGSMKLSVDCSYRLYLPGGDDRRAVRPCVRCTRSDCFYLFTFYCGMSPQLASGCKAKSCSEKELKGSLLS